MTDFACTAVDSGAATLDAKSVVINFTTTTEPVRLMLQVEEAPRLIALLLGLLRDAGVSASEGRMAPAFDVYGANVIGTRSDPTILHLEVKIQSDAPGLILKLPRKQLQQAAQDFLRMEGISGSDPSSDSQ